MQYQWTTIATTPSGKGWKAYAEGTTDYHFINWRGCNARWLCLPGQPMRGFKTPEEAEAWLLANFPDESDVERWAAGAGDDTHLNEREWYGDYAGALPTDGSGNYMSGRKPRAQFRWPK